MKTKFGYCPLCSTRAELHPVADAAGKVTWACKTESNTMKPGLSCWAMWTRAIDSPTQTTAARLDLDAPRSPRA